MTIISKIKWILGILLVFVLVLATNLIDRKSFNSVKDAMISIYEDRIIANDILFDMSAAIHKKELALVMADTAFFGNSNQELTQIINNLIARYEETRLTDEEKSAFRSFKKNFAELERAEAAYVESGYSSSDKLKMLLTDIKKDLEYLAKIQLAEARKQMLNSNRAIDLADMYSKIEIIFLVCLAVLIQVIVL